MTLGPESTPAASAATGALAPRTMTVPSSAKTATIRLNGVCDVACPFCELSGQGLLDTQGLGRVTRELREARAGGASVARLSGGEPLLEPKLLRVIRRARALGFDECVLETNALGADRPGAADRLRGAGLTGVIWLVHAADARAADALYARAGAHRQATAGARALVAAGLRLEARTPLSAPALAGLAALPAWLREAVGPVAAWRLVPLRRSPRSTFDPRLLPPLGSLGAAVEAARQAARAVSLPMTIEDDVGLPLCVFRQALASLRLLERRRGSGAAHGQPAAGDSAAAPPALAAPGHTYAAPCERCAVRRECPGLPTAYAVADTVARAGAAAAVDASSPFAPAPFRRRPAQLVGRQSRPENLVIYDQTAEAGAPGGARGPQVTVRVAMPCNQDCVFCFVDRTTPGLSQEALEEAVDAAARAGASRVSFSGGEPTLSPRLGALIDRARRRGVPERELQTNALLLEDAARCDALVRAGLTAAVVSLHAVEPGRYRAITRAGDPQQALRGAANLLARGVRLEVNVVHCAHNVDHLSEIVSTVAQRLPGARVVFSVTYIVDGLPRPWEEVAVRYAEAVPHLAAAVRLARRLGVDVGLAGRCGAPPCAWRGHLEVLRSLGLADRAGRAAEPGHRFLPACKGCAARAACHGVNEAYLARFGDGEIAPITPEEWELRARRP